VHNVLEAMPRLAKNVFLLKFYIKYKVNVMQLVQPDSLLIMQLKYVKNVPAVILAQQAQSLALHVQTQLI